MFQELPVNEKNIFAFKVSGKLSDEDYQQFVPRVEALIKEHGSIRLLIELEDFEGWDLKAAWDDFKFAREHEDSLERIAVVGEKRWQRWMVLAGSALTETEIRYFYKDHLQEAWDWLRSNEEDASKEKEASPQDIDLRPYRHIVVAVDFSRFSHAAVKRAIELGKKYEMPKLSLIHAVEHIMFPSGDTDGVIVPYDYLEQDLILFDAAKKRLEDFAKTLDYPDVHHEVIWGTPKSAVLSYAEAQQSDLIVAGSHGHHGLARLLGSTSSGIVNSARCEVLVVKLNE